MLFWATTLGFVVLLVARRRMFTSRPPAPWIDWVVVAVAVATLPLAARSVRNTAPFILFAVPAASRLLGAELRLPAAITRLFRRKPRPAEPRQAAPQPGDSGRHVGLRGGDRRVWPIASNHESLGWRPIGDDALAAARTCEGPLYNKYGDGGTLIWFLREKPVFVDGRQDPFSMPFLLEMAAVEAKQAPYRPLFERWRIRCAFLPADEDLVTELGKDGWNTRFRDKKYVVLEAPAAAAPHPNPLPAPRGEGTGMPTSRP